MTSKRHRGQYDPNHSAPYEISRGKIETFVKCNACFWLDRVAKVPFPSIPSFNLNSNTDKLLKRDLDKYRGKSSHPIMSYYGYNHLIPFEHSDLKKWESSLHFGVDDTYFNTIHHETNLLIGGGLDDIWIDSSKNILHIVDYKSTSNQSNNPHPVSLDGIWKEGYKRQMEIYQWIMRRKGFDVSDLGFFLYVDGLHADIPGMIDEDPQFGTMKFKTSILEYVGNTSWIEPLLYDIKNTLSMKNCPDHNADCEHGKFLEGVLNICLER